MLRKGTNGYERDTIQENSLNHLFSLIEIDS